MKSPQRGAALMLAGLVAAGCSTGAVDVARLSATEPTAPAPAITTTTEAPTTVATTTTAVSTTDAIAATTTTVATTAATTLMPSDQQTLREVNTIGGSISPKSVAASPSGLVFAQNMMYRHSVTVYDPSGVLLATIADTVDLAALGHPESPGPYRGAPVEAAFMPDGGHVYVSNYEMYGPGYSNPGNDTCRGNHYDDSYVYRIDTRSLAIDQAIKVGAVPKYVAVSPDGRLLLVSNWCSSDLSIIDTATATELQRIPLGPYPRGIVIDAQSRVAYVGLMGTYDIATVDLATFAVGRIAGVGNGPRHLVIDPAGRFLYATLNAEGNVAKVDLTTGTVVAKVHTGSRPRSMAIAPDGRSLFVVNYDSATMTKLRADDLAITQTVKTGVHPIGITTNPATGDVWVACYSGSITLFADG
jgi:YVTN family beta-propeller protein